MSTDKKYFIKIKNQLVEVSKEVYIFHYKTKRRALYLTERNQKHGVVSYHSQDILKNLSEDITGEETIYDTYAPTPEDLTVESIMNEELHKALKFLTKDEMALIQALFFDGLTEVDMAKRYAVNQSTINRRKVKIIEKLKKFIEN